jgi:hypothetical protein
MINQREIDEIGKINEFKREYECVATLEKTADDYCFVVRGKPLSIDEYKGTRIRYEPVFVPIMSEVPRDEHWFFDKCWQEAVTTGLHFSIDSKGFARRDAKIYIKPRGFKEPQYLDIAILIKDGEQRLMCRLDLVDWQSINFKAMQ